MDVLSICYGCPRGLLRMTYECLGCLRDAVGMPWAYIRDVVNKKTVAPEGCIRDVRGMSWRCLRDVLGVALERDAPGAHWECLWNDPDMSQGCLTDVLGMSS
eukprot:6085315-Pyramimonas_sp.AAC.1